VKRRGGQRGGGWSKTPLRMAAGWLAAWMVAMPAATQSPPPHIAPASSAVSSQAAAPPGAGSAVVRAPQGTVSNGKPAIRFEEIGARSKARMIHHTRHFHGPKADILEMFTSGGAAVAVGDYDNDGFDDLFVTD
jgi:hypothetical protein